MEDQKEYERGFVAGEIATRLAGHDRHFEAINGSLAEMVKELRDLKLNTQSIRDQNAAAAITAVATAAALKEADEARRATSERIWTTPARVIAVVSVLVALASVALAYYVATRH